MPLRSTDIEYGGPDMRDGTELTDIKEKTLQFYVSLVTTMLQWLNDCHIYDILWYLDAPW